MCVACKYEVEHQLERGRGGQPWGEREEEDEGLGVSNGLHNPEVPCKLLYLIAHALMHAK